MKREHLPYDAESAKKSGLAGATNATSSPDETPCMRRRDTLIPNKPVTGAWQAIGDLARLISERAAKQRGSAE